MSFRDLLPPTVHVAEGQVDDPRWAGLVPPDEAALVSGRAERVAEFVAGRGCARKALAALQPAPALIGVRRDRAPQWPAGVVGAITHAGGEVAAAVADGATLEGLGIDVEPVAPMEPGTVDLVTTATERAAAAVCDLGGAGALVVFCAKEAVFKAWAPTRGWLEFDDADVRLDPDGGLVATVGDSRLPGRWEVADGRVRAAVLLTRPR